MNIAMKTVEFDPIMARKALKKAIAIRDAAQRDLENLNGIIADAERRIDKLREDAQQFSTLMAQMAEAASNALRDNAELTTPPQLAGTKRRHQKAVEDIEFATAGLDSLKAKREQVTRDVAVLTARAKESAEPLVVDEGECLATEVARLESLAAVARAKLVAFSQSGQGGIVQKLGPRAYTVLRNPPSNSIIPQTNTDLWRRSQSFKKSVVDFRNALEADAGAQLSFSDDERG
ncbi:MAG TPA: hypothetical protein VIE66_09490 [Methylocella sp.]|jgi:uncharacterized coiled-coil protein SlyX